MPPSDKRAAARRLLAARARRVARIRRGVVAGALAAFAMAWGVIAATGSMGTATASDTASSSSASSSSDATRSVTPSTDEPTPLTTQQS